MGIILFYKIILRTKNLCELIYKEKSHPYQIFYFKIDKNNIFKFLQNVIIINDYITISLYICHHYIKS